LEPDENLPQSREELVQFLEHLASTFDPSSPEWENQTIAEYLYGCAGWLRDADGAYANAGLPVPDSISWTLVARIFWAGQIYE
jgi:hypothetical protein